MFVTCLSTQIAVGAESGSLIHFYFRNTVLHTLDSGVQMVWMARIKELSVISKRFTLETE